MLLVMDEQRVILDHLYEMIRVHSGTCEIFRLNSSQQRNLGAFLASVAYRDYERIILFTRVKRQLSQLPVLRCIPGLVILEHDACQNYMAESKYRGAYSKLFASLPWARAIVSGCGVTRRLQGEGVDAVFVSKGYDERLLRDLGRPRNVPVAFLGSFRSDAYAGRRAVLERIAAATDLLVTRTSSGAEYLELLNRIRIFVSADVGMGEYMIKNFEAMACGCTLLAWFQGGEEEAALGLQDMQNVVLYRSAEEAIAKIDWLLANPEQARQIADQGKAFVERNYGFARVGRDIAQAVLQPMRPWPGVGRLRRGWVKWRYGMEVA